MAMVNRLRDCGTSLEVGTSVTLSKRWLNEAKQKVT